MSVLDFFGEEDTRITQLVYDISGSNANDQLGHSISIGLSGEIIAVGAPTISQGGTERGLVRVYQKLTDLSGVSSWNQMGADLAGSSDNEQFGHSVDLNRDGTILAIGTKDPSNTLLVYNYDGSSWNQYGNTIYLDNNTAFETSISHITKGKLNYDGTKLVALNHNLGSSTTTSVGTTTVTHTSPYVTAGCTNNFDFRVNESTSITDDIGGIVVTYQGGGTSNVTDGFETTYTAGGTNDPVKFMYIQPSFTYGGECSVEIYMNAISIPYWSRVFRWQSPVDMQWGRYGSEDQYYIAMNGSNGEYFNCPIVSGQFDHLVFTVTSDGTGKLYYNGSLQETETGINMGTAATLTSSTVAAIGCYPTNERGTNIQYKYLRYYHGKVLSQSEVTDLYNDRDDTSTATGRDGTTQEGPSTVTTTITTTEYIQNDSVESFEYSSTDWAQVGNTIQSTSVNDISGGDIAINDSGNTIAIGYPEGKSAIPSTYTYTVTAGSVFEFYGEEYSSDTNNPALSFKRGSIYVLNINTTSLHPFWIQTSDNGGSYDSANVYSSGITNNGIYDGTITFVVPMDAPDTLYYRCGSHGNMGNSISITTELSATGIAKVFQYDTSWNQVGSNIDGSGENDYFGSSIAMDSSGEFIAVGGPFAGDASAGHVKVYQNVNNTWNQTGNQIQGNTENDQFGSAVDMNSDGKVIVVGAKNADSGKGAATVYQYKNIVSGYNTSDLSWNRIGAGITGDSTGDFVGTSVGIIREGTEFSVGAPGKQVDTNDNAGTVESYTFDYEKISDTEPRFTQILTPILGTAANDRMGEVVVTSLTGDVIAISAPNNSGGGVERGLVRVYQKGDSSWTQLGSDLTGTNDNDQFGYSLDINADGTILAVGTKHISHNTLVYKYNSGSWGLYGNTIYNQVSYDTASILSVSTKPKLNKSGDKLIILNETHLNTEFEGHVQCYQYSNSDVSWNYLGDKIESTSVNDISGGDIAINHSGDLIAVGYPNANGSGEQSGTTKIFKYNANDASWNQVSDNINGSTTGDLAGTSLTFDMCDNYLGISSPFAGNNSEGSVNVYKITDNSWEHFGNIDGLTANEQLGSIAMTPSAEIIAVGSKTAFDGAGVVRIYMNNSNLSNSFEKLSGDISGSTYTYNPTVQTETGSSIFLSEDGQIISVGEPGYNVGTDDNTGRVRVFNVDIPQPPAPEEGDWLYNYSTSNALKSIYMKGMLEMDNATLRTRNENNNLIGSVDASFNGGNVYLGETVKIGTETVKSDITLDVSGNTNISGNLKIIGDLSAISQITVDHVDISGDLIVSGDNTNISLSSQDVNYNSELNITDAPLTVNKTKLSASAGKEPITVENVLSDGNYSQIGENIWGPQDGGSWVVSSDWTGSYTAPMSINDTGDIIVIGYSAYDGLNSGAGLARAYQYMSITENEYNSGNTNAYTSTSAFNGASGVPIIANNSVAWSAEAKFWVQLGDDIESFDGNTPTNTFDQLGRTVSINGVGDIIAIATPRDDDNGQNTGKVGVFKYSTPGTIGGTWDLIGNIMEFTFTTSTNTAMGTHMQLDQSGKIIAISSDEDVNTVDIPSSMKIQDDSTDYTNVSVTTVFQYRTVTESEFNAGNTTSFNPNDGTPIIQANGGTWNATTEYWVQLGNYMYIPYNNNYGGSNGTMSMSSDGSRVMIGARGYRPDDSADSDTNQGATEVFEYSTPGTINGTWNRLGARMFGVTSYGYGYKLTAAMSPDGNVVSLSHFDADGISYATGHYGVVRAMEYRLVTQTEWDNAKKAATDDITTTIGVPLIYPDGDTVLNTTKKYWIQMGADLFNWYTSGTGRYCRIGYTYGGYMISQMGTSGDYGRIYKYTTVSESEYNSRSTTFTDRNYTTPPSSVIFTNGESWASDKKFWVQVGDHISSPIAYGDQFHVWNFTRDGTKFIAGAGSADLNSISGCSCVQVYGFNTEVITIGYNYQSIVTDVSMVNAAATFGEDVSLNPALSVPGNILIVDSSNSEYNYGSYTIHTDKDYTNYFAVGKSASDVFNIVNNNNSGVYMSSSANSFTGTSDERLKKNVCDIKDKDLENLQQLRPVSYKWKKQTDDTEHYGFIAQEVEKYLPNLVDENTCPDGSTYKGVAVDDLIPYMIKYIQKLKKKIAEKEKEMET